MARNTTSLVLYPVTNRFTNGIGDRVENLSETQFAYLLLAPMGIVLFAMAFWPLGHTFYMSLHADDLYTADWTGAFVGLENYVGILTGEYDARLPRPLFSTDQIFTSALTVTLIFTIVAVVLETILGFAMALILDQSFRGRRWVRMGFIFPWTVPIVIQGMIFYLFFQPGIGPGVELMQGLGVFSSTPLASSVDSLIIVIFADIWKQSAFMALLILAGLQSINRDLYKVGEVAGASRWQRFKTITFPLVLPALLVALLFRTIAALHVYGTIETVTHCSTVPSLSCLVIETFNAGRYASAASIAFITASIIGVLLLGYLLVMRRVGRGAV
ncbi:carbohydrate ABC transporter permease [Natrarchaeobius sp. A-rgal3]|uniref:carbohydrate ABC transporter permease n=1 Tax=Natrarchaeobius versutus TaxID=1679078 RepID=UPI00350F9A66